jgi:hypothetical protein
LLRGMTSVATLPRASKSEAQALGRISRPLYFAYCLVCLSVIALGFDRRYPEIRRQVTLAIWGPQVSHPYPDCATAHAAGVYNIRRGSPAYTLSQDANNDGVACEPPPFKAPDLSLKSPI